MTAVPAAIDALIGAFESVPGVRVIDGPWLQRPSERDVVVVGWTPEEGSTVEFVNAIAGLGSSRETFDVSGLVSSWDGGTVMKTVRDRVDQIVEALRGRLVADPTLGGAVNRARLASAAVTQEQTDQGAVAEALFTVHVDAFRIP